MAAAVARAVHDLHRRPRPSAAVVGDRAAHLLAVAERGHDPQREALCLRAREADRSQVAAVEAVSHLAVHVDDRPNDTLAMPGMLAEGEPGRWVARLRACAALAALAAVAARAALAAGPAGPSRAAGATGATGAGHGQRDRHPGRIRDGILRLHR